MAKGHPFLCEQCGTVTREGSETEYGLLCSVCAFHQFERDESRASFAHLSPRNFGFLDDDD